MHLRIQVVAVSDDGREQQKEIADLLRSEARLETLGLRLEESKQLLQELQRTMIEQQVQAYLDQQRACPACGKQRILKQSGRAPFRTLFGLVSVLNPRWQQCDCQTHQHKTFRPLKALLAERSSPDERYLETKWASLRPYGVTTKVVTKCCLSTRNTVQPRYATIRYRRRGGASKRWAKNWPCLWKALRQSVISCRSPTARFRWGWTARVDRARRGATHSKRGNLFEVIAGKSILAFHRDDPQDVPASSKCFALLRSVDQKPKRRLFELLHSQGMQANQQLTFFSDGGDTVRMLPEYLHPDSETQASRIARSSGPS
jgi:hypothetical protein